MVWSEKANRNVKSRFDRIYLSEDEYFSLSEFIDAYLRDNFIDSSIANKNKLQNLILKFPGKGKVRYDDIISYVNSKFPKGKM